MKKIIGGLCAPLGFVAGGIHCGIRKNKSKRDLAMLVCEVPCTAAGVYTTNLVKGATILVTQENLSDGVAQAMICNSGNANTCNADGVEVAKKMCSLVEEYTGVKKEDVIVASTGVIGMPLDVSIIERGMKALTESLGDNSSMASEAILTTDTVKKELAFSFEISGKPCKIGGIAKGSGMIHPNMATMLVFLTTDVNISAELLQEAVSEDVLDTFNMVSVDGDTSTNDMLTIMASGLAQNDRITTKNADYTAFCQALHEITSSLCRQIAKDGEGATKLIECQTVNATDKQTARTVAKSVITSSLLKAAMFGADANWGRVLCAIGYSGAKLDISKIDVYFRSSKGSVLVCKNGAGVTFSEEKAKEILLEKDIIIYVDLNDGQANATAYGCDLTYDYVKINGDYRT